MRQLTGYLYDFARKGHSRRYFSFSLLFVLSFWGLNYGFGVARTVELRFAGTPAIYLLYAGLYTFALLVSFGSQLWLERRWKLLRQPQFWTLNAGLLVTLTLLSAARIPHLDWSGVAGARYALSLLLANYGVNTLVYLLFPAGLLVWACLRRYRGGSPGLAARPSGLARLGLTGTGASGPQPYLWIVLLLAPLLLAASFSRGFLEVYPLYRQTGAALELGLAPVLVFGLFELAYGLNFVALETFFRGFALLGFTRQLGRSALIPVATLYCFMHFTKPPAEALLSFFGGLALGIIALRTRSIVGGIIVHLGVAWLMELFSHFQLWRLDLYQ